MVSAPLVRELQLLAQLRDPHVDIGESLRAVGRGLSEQATGHRIERLRKQLGVSLRQLGVH
eukprot:2322031-Prymnesium_polylepis.1